MKLAASQIAWQPQDEAEALGLLQQAGFAGVEIAPTRVAGPQPYDDVQAARAFAAMVKKEYGLAVCSLQSIWYGQSGNIFGPQRNDLLAYTQKAILFAQAAGAGNLVFGCPKNRVLGQGQSPVAATLFFKELGDFAAAHGTVLALEALPEFYGSRFITTTAEAFKLVETVASPGFKVNLDVATMLAQGEDAGVIQGRVGLINHVHVSDLELGTLLPRPLHRRLAQALQSEGYAGYVSIEMKTQPLMALRQAVAVAREGFA